MWTISALVVLCCHIVPLCSYQGMGVVYVTFSARQVGRPLVPLLGPWSQLISARACALASRFTREEEKKQKQVVVPFVQLTITFRSEYFSVPAFFSLKYNFKSAIREILTISAAFCTTVDFTIVTSNIPQNKILIPNKNYQHIIKNL